MARQKYTIMEKIDAGGMAEVWKARSSSMHGFDKMVAIKRVLPNLAQKQKFLDMFLDEARLSLFLNHGNVVQTFDIGRSDNSYFIVMEWISGSNLKTVLEMLSLQGKRLATAEALLIAIEICKGLGHAHQRKDNQGEPLNIVHRDVSPPNVLITHEGEVKLVDFGLAKAAVQISQTEPGVVKGKFSYLSPEAAYGREVDYRADIFATGILLWEMLTGSRLFYGENDLETVKQVRAAHIPPLRGKNRQVDAALEQIVFKALAREPKDRYQSCGAFGEALTHYLFDRRMTVSTWDIARTVADALYQRSLTRPISIINLDSGDATIQEELDQLKSIDDLAKMNFQSISEVTGLQGTSGEDPRAWARELGVADTRDDARPFRKINPPQQPPRGPGVQVSRSAGSQAGRITGAHAARVTGPHAARATGPVAGQITGQHLHTMGHSSARRVPAELPKKQMGGLATAILGVLLGFVGAALVGGLAWYFLFK